MSKSVWHSSFSIWLMSLSMMPSRSIRVVANGKVSFFMAEYYSVVCVPCLLIQHLDRPLGCFRSLALGDSSAVTTAT